MFDILRYSPSPDALRGGSPTPPPFPHASAWNAFVGQAKNATFLFHRDYMDYHADRFNDCSLMIYEDGRLFALLPANVVGDVLYSHQGLTYGGLIMGASCRAAKVRDCFVELNDCLRRMGIRKVVYKHIPHVYCTLPSEEDLFALSNVCRAALKTRDIASVVDLSRPLPFSQLRRRGVKKAVRAGLLVTESDRLADFWQVLQSCLLLHHQARPVHSLAEMALLKARFPENIRLFVATHGGSIVGGTLLYVSRHIVKTQYIAASEDGRQLGALDFIFDHLLRMFADEGRRFFDFGTSNLVGNDDLNESLIFQKEGFGGRAVCYDTYEWNL